MCKETRENMMKEIETLLNKSKEDLKQVEFIIGNLEKAVSINLSLQRPEHLIVH